MYKFILLTISISLIVAGCGLIDDKLTADAESYIYNFKEKEFKKAAGYLYCPDSLSKEEGNNELSEMSGALELIFHEFGSPDSAKSSTNEDFIAVAVGCGTAHFWQEYPPSRQLIFEVRYPENESGFIVFSYSLVGEQYVLAFVNHGSSKSHPNARKKIYEVLKKLEESM